jgi:hypothetical protein
MQNCQFCGCQIKDSDGAVIPGMAMATALNNGYKPTMCPNWETMRHLECISVELDKSDVLAIHFKTENEKIEHWESRLRFHNVSWRICNICFSTLGHYLPAQPIQSIYPQAAPNQDMLESFRYIVPLNCPVIAIIAGYSAFFAVLLFPAPIALILGIFAMWHIKKNKEKKLEGKGRAIFAVVMGTIFTVILIFFLVGSVVG